VYPLQQISSYFVKEDSKEIFEELNFAHTYISSWNDIFIVSSYIILHTNISRKIIRGNFYLVAMNEIALSVRTFFLSFQSPKIFAWGIMLSRLVRGWILPICPGRRVRYLFHLLGLARKPPFSPCRKPSSAAAAANINPRRNSLQSVPTLSSLPHFSFPRRLLHPFARVRVYPPTLSGLNARNLWPCTLSSARFRIKR